MQIAKHSILPLLIFSMFFLAMSCSKDDDSSSSQQNNPNNPGNTSQTDEEMLTAKTWTSFKVLNSGDDVTSSSSTMSLNFDSDGTYSATSFVGGSGDSWSLSSGSLDLGDAGTWSVLELSVNLLKVKDSSGVVEIHFN